jgi:hypothetical protein
MRSKTRDRAQHINGAWEFNPHHILSLRFVK